MKEEEMTDRRRILSFTGTRNEFFRYWRDLIAGPYGTLPQDGETYEWELTAELRSGD